MAPQILVYFNPWPWWLLASTYLLWNTRLRIWILWHYGNVVETVSVSAITLLYTILTFRFRCGSVCLCRWHHPISSKHVVKCLRWCRHNYHHFVCVQSHCKQVCALHWSASCIVELWVGNCRWCHQHKHTLPHRDLKVKSDSSILHLTKLWQQRCDLKIHSPDKQITAADRSFLV